MCQSSNGKYQNMFKMGWSFKAWLGAGPTPKASPYYSEKYSFFWAGEHFLLTPRCNTHQGQAPLHVLFLSASSADKALHSIYLLSWRHVMNALLPEEHSQRLHILHIDMHVCMCVKELHVLWEQLRWLGRGLIIKPPFERRVKSRWVRVAPPSLPPSTLGHYRRRRASSQSIKSEGDSFTQLHWSRRSGEGWRVCARADGLKPNNTGIWCAARLTSWSLSSRNRD